jgi:hypothetical protein
VIYSLEERSKLVFLIEALPVEPANMRVGQPVDVLLDKDAKNLDAKNLDAKSKEVKR